MPFENLEPLDGLCSGTEPEHSAAVLIAITRSISNPEILFTRRADHLTSHAGQVSFPGGRWEQVDGSLQQTALRETHEELGVHPELISLRGWITPRVSIHGLLVWPFVGQIPEAVSVHACPDEIADTFRVPLGFFQTVKPSRIDVRNRNGTRFEMPVWDYEGFDIWGLTARFTLDLLERLGIEVDMATPPRREL